MGDRLRPEWVFDSAGIRSPEPSAEDLALTDRLRAVGDLIGIRILDHVILGHDGAFRSLADDGRLGGGR